MSNETQGISNTSLRFAGLIRVSTEQQGRMGESLRTQRKRIESIVEMLGGEIVKYYEGQEHASENHERAIFDQLLEGAKQKLFDAVMVCDVSRWSRDQIKALEGLQILRNNGIKFYVEAMEFDLSKPESEFTLNILSAAAKLQVDIGAYKSIQNKIARAERGWPVCGNPPFGRRLVGNSNTDTGYKKGKKRIKKIHLDTHGYAHWEIIPEDQELVNRLYDMYVSQGLSFQKMEEITGIERTHIRYILMDRCGDTWKQTFKDKAKNTKKEVLTKVPALLTPEQIAAVKHKARVNQQFREIKYQYPLSHFVRCGVCGQTLTSQAEKPRSGKRFHYYIHRSAGKTRKCVGTVRGKMLEEAVFAQIGQMLKNTENLKSAINRVVDRSIEGKEKIRSEIQKLEKRKEELETERSRVIRFIRKELIDEKDAEKELLDIKSGLDIVQKKLDQYRYELSSLQVDLSPEILELAVNQYYSALTGLNGYAPMLWSVEEQQKLARFFFGTKNKQLGVFVKSEKHPELGDYRSYVIKGVLGVAEGAVAKRNYEVLSDMASEMPSRDVKLSDLAELINSLDKSQLPENLWSKAYRNTYMISTSS